MMMMMMMDGDGDDDDDDDGDGDGDGGGGDAVDDDYYDDYDDDDVVVGGGGTDPCSFRFLMTWFYHNSNYDNPCVYYCIHIGFCRNIIVHLILDFHINGFHDLDNFNMSIRLKWVAPLNILYISILCLSIICIA